MTKQPRYHVRAVSLLGERFEADGWLEIRTRGSELPWWESRCKVVGGPYLGRPGSLPIVVRLELAAGGKFSGHAYVDRPFQLWGDRAALKIHGTSQGFQLHASDADHYVVSRREALKQAALVPFRVLVFLLVAVATIVLLILALVLVFAPQILFPARPAF